MMLMAKNGCIQNEKARLRNRMGEKLRIQILVHVERSEENVRKTVSTSRHTSKYNLYTEKAKTSPKLKSMMNITENLTEAPPRNSQEFIYR